MEMTRRTFNRILASSAILCAAAARRLVARAGPERVLRAMAARRFPGRVRALDDAEVGRRGPWSG